MKRWYWLLAVVVLGVGLRTGVVLTLKTYQGDSGAYEHHEIATALAQGEGFVYRFFSPQAQLSSHQAPAVPYALSVWYRLLGAGSPQALLAHELFQVFLAAAALLALYAIGEMLWDRRVGLVAAALLAVYPPLVYAVTRVQAVNWTMPFLLLLVVGLVATRRSWSVTAAVGAGLAGGLGVLGEPTLGAALGLGWFGLLVAAIRADAQVRRRALRAALVAALVSASVVGPWIVRNTIVHGQPAFVKSTFWYVFWQGNNLRASGTDKREVAPELQEQLAWGIGMRGLEAELAAARRQAVSVDETLTSTDLRELAELPNEIARMTWFKHRILGELATDPMHYPQMCLRRLWQLLWFDPTNPRAFALAYRLSWLLLALAALGGLACVLADPGRRTAHGAFSARPRWWAPVVLSPLGLFIVHVLVITSARFRLPIEAVLLLPAALLMVCAYDAVRRR